MKKNFFLTLMLALVALFSIETATAQAPVATPEQAITGLLNRIGGDGAADKFEIVIDANLAENGKDVFVITAQNGKPCIKGNTQLSVATGINWYLNHYAHINLTWNNLTTDLSQVELPLPGADEKHVCNTTYRYDFNTCTFSYSMAFWTWDRWQKEIDWMALHGINAPLNLVGLEVVTRNFLREIGVTEADINDYIAGPGFMAWFAMNNLEGWGSTINSPSTGVSMSGNPDWWYTRQEQLCRNMMQRMRELGMQPVIPGFSGQVPKCLTGYTTIDGFSGGDVVTVGSWASNFPHPGVVNPSTNSYKNLADVYYKHLHDVMGISEFYSIDPFHEMSAPVAANVLYPNIMSHLDRCYALETAEERAKFNAPELPKWIIQYWQGTPVTGAFSAMSSYGDRFIALDLFADNIYADNAAKWRTTYYNGRPYIYCMLHNFGGRSGMHGRLQTTMDGYFEALAKNNNCQGIGATPEGTETNPVLYDMLFELPWMDVNNRPTADEWLKDYAYSRYGVENDIALEALKNLKKSVWDCKVNQQGTSEAIILARPNWTVNSVSSWSTSAIYWDTQDVRLAADQLISIADLVTTEDGIANYNYDVIDAIRQAMVDYAAELLPLINAARGNTAEYTRLYQLYLQLMLDLDTMLSYDEGFKLERWTSLARNIADEVAGTTENDRNWLEWNARTQVTVWANQDCALHDYSNRCWAGLIKDFHYKRWEKFFTTNGGSFDGGWYRGFEYPWTVDFNNTYNLASDYSQVVIPNDMTATEKAVETFGKYFGRVKGIEKNYIFPMGVASNATKSMAIPEVYRGQEVELPLIIGKEVTISSVWIDLNNDGNAGNGETLTANGNSVTIPADAAIGKTTAKVTYSDGTVITFNLALIEDIANARTVTAVAGANGSVAIEGTNELSITTTKAVKITATANTGYNFKEWTDAQGNVVGNDNPFIYYGKEAATFTANFIQNKWGVPSEDKGDWGDAQVKTSFVNELTFAYYNREPETIYEASVAPDNLFNTIPQIINVPQGASFDVTWSDNGDNGLRFCCLSAYIDLNADGDFTDEGELLKVAGTKGAQNTAACEGKINVILPYDAPLGITHMRLRFDGAWKDNGYDAATKSYDAKAQLNRMCYEVVINVTEKSDKAATINVETNAADWGTVEVWTDETPTTETFKEYNVSANIPMYLRATKASEDVEFLGWYDQYGRLVTENLEHTMYAREDATYTARFRKFLNINGWQIEYRTEPGKDVVTTKLANGVKPEAGKKYYIAADAKQSNGSFVSYYLYDNGTALKTSTSVSGNSYLWTCTVNNDGTYSFQNESGKYLANDGSYYLSIGATPAKYAFETANAGSGVALTNVSDGYTGSKWMVTKFDGSAFNKNSVSVNNGSWCNDYIFTEVTVPEVVILTKVRKSGDHDLEIPETVEILGQQCKIVGFDNNLFKDNKDLWTISLPATIEEMSNNKVFTGVVKGKGANASADASNYITTELGTTLAAGEDWSISLTIQDNGNNFNQWGSALIATGNAPMNPTYAKGFQLYMQSTSNGGKLIVKLDNENNNNALASISKGTKYRIDIVYTHANTQLVVTATSLESAAAIAASRSAAARTTNSLTLTQDMSDFTVVSHAIPEGVNITNLEVRKGTEPDPFEGCTNLLGVTVDAANENYIVEGRTLKSTGGTTLHTLADEEKAEEIRALAELIDLAEALIAEVATNINPTGKETALALTTTGSSFYVSTNADQNTGGGNSDGGGIAALVDNNEGTYFHSRWSGIDVNAPHYIQVDLGDGNSLSDFKFSYVSADGPDPTRIVVKGSNNGEQFDQIGDIIIKDAINSGATYASGIIEAEQPYSYLRFEVTGSYRWNANATPQGEYCFSMKEFDIYDLTSTAEVAPKYANLAGVTAKEVEDVYDSLAEALYYYNNGGTVDELAAAHTALEPLYTALKAKKEKVFNGVYNIVYNNKPVFIAYSEPALTGVNGYELYDATTENGNPTSPEFVDAQAKAINGMKPADALIIIAPNGESTGYTLSVQGLYMKTTKPGDWASQSFDSNEEQAGVYLFEEVETDVYKLKSNAQSIQYVYDWGHVFGNNEVSEGVVSTYEIVPVTEYTLTVPANGATTLCLPFNVVLPEGVTAYDLAKANITTTGKYSLYELVEVAGEGETLAKNTPVIIKADEGDYTLAITMNGEGAKVSVENSVLRSAIVKSTVAAGNNYTFDGENFNRVATDTEIAANQCYMVLDENVGDVIYNEVPKTVFNGVYNIVYDGEPLFVAYAAANEFRGLTGAGNAGYRLFDAKVDNSNDSGDTTNEAYKQPQTDAINAKVAADALFTIVPSGDGYKISAQGQYMRATGVYAQWSIQAFDTDANNAGIYLFEETATPDEFKLKSTINVNKQSVVTNYVNDWGPVFGNDDWNKPNLSTFTLTPVTEYTLNVPANGATTLCLPFNVVLPEGVTAYDLAKANITVGNKYSTYELVKVAGEDETLAKNTPVIIKAAEANPTLAITMDDEGAKVSAGGSVLRSAIVKSTVAAGNNYYTFDGENFNLVAANTEIAANKCYMALDGNVGDVIYGKAPEYLLTTDEENPVLYKIIIKRADDDSKVLSYDEPTSEKIKIVDKVTDNSYQAWYFVQGKNGIQIKPYNADGKMLTVESTNDGEGVAKIAAEADGLFQEWSITKSTVNGCTDYYYIKVVGSDGNAGTLSHNSGFNATDYLGIWADGFGTNDGGSLFKFVEAEFTDENARFYQLKDLAESMDDATYYTGESVGLYSTESVTAYREKLAEAQTLIDATSATSASSDCYVAYKALRAADEALVYNAPDANKLYYIVSTSTHDYCKGKYVHTYSEPHNHSGNIYDQKHLLFNAAENISNLYNLSLAAFSLEETGAQGEYKMKNLHTGLYVKSFAESSGHMGVEAEAAVVKITAIADGQVTLKIGTDAPMHAQDNHSVIVPYDDGVGSASSWTINEVPQGDLNKIYKLTVPESGVATLNLAFNVLLPQGVTAYDFVEGDIVPAEDGNSYEFNLTEEVATAGEVLAKNTPVIIRAAAGEYNLQVIFSDDNVKSGTVNSVLRGNYWQTTVGVGTDNAVNYLPAVVDNRFVFNKVAADAAVAANTVWAVLSSADKGETIKEFVPKPEAPKVEIVAGKVYRIKNYTVNTPDQYKEHYLANSNASIVFPTKVEADDKSAMWVCTSADEENHKYKFVSALGTASFGWQGAAEEAFEYTIAAGTIDETVTLINNNMSLALTTEAWNNKGYAAFNKATVGYGTNGMVQAEYWSTDWYLEEVENPNVSFTASIRKDNMWATMYLPYAVTIPQGVEVYYASGIDNVNKVVNLTSFVQTIPARTAVLLRRAGDAPSTDATADFKFDIAEDVAAVETVDEGDNLFDGTIMQTAIAAPQGTRVYLLTNYNATEKFYWMAAEYDVNCKLSNVGGYVKNDANKAYLKIENAKSASLGFRFDGATGIEDVDGESGEVKTVYDLQGRKLTEVTKPGFYIVDGKKVWIK